MRSLITRAREKWLRNFFKKDPFVQESLLIGLLRKYSSHGLILLGLVIFSLLSEILPLAFKEEPKTPSLDSLVPKDFVLIPIELSNGTDIINIIGSYGVVDLYAYSNQTHVPEKQVAKAIKIIPPDKEEGHFAALIPEQEARHLFKYPKPFYAVIQNPNKRGSKVYKKKEKSVILVEDLL